MTPDSLDLLRTRQWSAYGEILFSGLLVTAVGALAGLTYATGSTESGLTYLILLPVLLAAARYGLVGGLGLGLLGAFLLAPWVPGFFSLELHQATQQWMSRLLVFGSVGLVAGSWCDRFVSQLRGQIESERIDPNAGIPNQLALREQLAGRLQSQGSDGQRLVAVVLLRATDLDDIVDVTGLEGGDHVLGVLAGHLQRVCPEVAGVYRFGSSDLALIVETEDYAALKRVIRSLHDAASSSSTVDGAPVRIEPALGIGHSGMEPWEGDELIRRARVALRRATKLEKDWVGYEPAFDADGDNTVELIARVEAALDAGEFELHYQPKIRLADRSPAGVEALARWRRPDEGLVPPGSFMSKLEKTSLIDNFSRFVIATATDFARTGTLVPVSINLAPRNLADETLIDDLIEGLRVTNTPPGVFEVEITESALMREPENSIRLIERLRESGVGVSIDDFGTGYSSFAYLRRLPATDLKIDRAFVRPLEGDAKARRLVLAMIESGHALGMTVTAEGIETEAQARILAELDCDLGQGFLWSAARTETELYQWLECETPQ